MYYYILFGIIHTVKLKCFDTRKILLLNQVETKVNKVDLQFTKNTFCNPCISCAIVYPQFKGYCDHGTNVATLSQDLYNYFYSYQHSKQHLYYSTKFLLLF